MSLAEPSAPSRYGSPAVDPVSERLLRSTARSFYDPETDIDWAAPPVEGLWWMSPERMSLYGTRSWQRLSEEQRLTLSMHEIASIASVGVWFEIALMQVLLREAYNGDPRSSRVQWALTEVGDETRHSVMFGKAIGSMGVPAYGPRPEALRMGRLAPIVLRGACAYAGILIGEEPVDRLQRETAKDERVQPLVRMVSRIHVVEEARHVTFAREELVAAMQTMRPRSRRWHQSMTARLGYVTMRSLVHPQVYTSVGLDPQAARREALGNESYRATVAWMGEKVMPFLDECGLVSPKDRKLWRGSFLLP